MKMTGKKASGLNSFQASIGFDQKLYREDIAGSIAHAKGLAKIGILSSSELSLMTKGLKEIELEIDEGKFNWAKQLEDIHMAVEVRLTQKIGPIGGKLHTGRSRNDQVATDLRLFCKKKIGEAACLLAGLQGAIVKIAEEKGMIPMPGYTHLQRAQAVLWAHHWLAYFEMFSRDRERLSDLLKRTNISPLGSGALAGTTFPIDREFTAKELGFDGITKNSLDAVSDRDFVVEFLFVLSLVMVHLSRLCEELILWSSQEFRFISLPEEFCTGSSMMPQKINPDVPELIRGKSGRVFGHLIGMLTVLKGLPLAYNKDLQEDKEGLFDAIDTVCECVKILTEMIPGIEANAAKMKQATEEGFLLATDLADYLVAKGIPFREGHEIVGNIVFDCGQKGKTLEKMSLTELKKYSDRFEDDIGSWLDIEASTDKRKSIGGTSASAVKKELDRAKLLLKKKWQ